MLLLIKNGAKPRYGMPIELSSNFLLMKSGNGISLHASYGEKKKTVDVYSPELNTKYTKAPEHGTDSVPDYIVDTGMNCTAENAIAYGTFSSVLQ